MPSVGLRAPDGLAEATIVSEGLPTRVALRASRIAFATSSCAPDQHGADRSRLPAHIGEPVLFPARASARPMVPCCAPSTLRPSRGSLLSFGNVFDEVCMLTETSGG